MIKNKILLGLLAVLAIAALLLAGCAATITLTTSPSIPAETPSPVIPVSTLTASPATTTTTAPATTDVPTPTPKPSPTSSSTPSIKFEGRFIDVHTHIGLVEMSLEQIIQDMDSEGIDTMIIMDTPTAIYKGMPPEKSGIPGAAEQYPGRFVALYGGEAITMLDEFADRAYTQADEDKYVALLEAAMQTGQYAGFGEIALRHFPVSGEAGSSDVTVPGDHPWMYILSDIAAKYDVPVDIHMEAMDETVPGLEKLLAHNNNTKIIWDHAGWTNTGDATPQLMRQLMEKYPNLYTSIKIRASDTPEMIAVSILDDNGHIKSEWMALFEDYPDRFMMGSDIKPGLRENEFRYIKKHRAVLEQLPSSILKKIERENAIALFNLT